MKSWGYMFFKTGLRKSKTKKRNENKSKNMDDTCNDKASGKIK